MHSTPSIRTLLVWLAQLPPSVWWHLGGTESHPKLFLQHAPESLDFPKVKGLRVRFLDPAGVVYPLH